MRAAAYTLYQRSRDFARSWVAYRVAAKWVLFLKALDTDVNKKVRALHNTVLKHLSVDEAREAVYQKYVKPQLPPEDLNALPLDRLPDDTYRASMVEWAKAAPKPDPVKYFLDLMGILRGEDYPPLDAAYIARDVVIQSIGLDRIDRDWVRVWREIEVTGEQVLGMHQEGLSEP